MNDLEDEESNSNFMMSSFKHMPDFKSKEIVQQTISLQQIDEQTEKSLTLQHLELQKSEMSNKLYKEG